MTLLHRELGPRYGSVEKLRDRAKTTRKFGRRVAELLAYGPAVTEAMLDPDLSHTLPLVDQIKGIPTKRVADDPSILIAPEKDERLYHTHSRGAGDYTLDSRWKNR